MRLALLDDYQNLSLELADWSALRGRCDLVVFDRHLSEDEAAARLAEFDMICLMRERMDMPRSLIERLPKLKFIAVTGPQNRTLDLAATAERGIVVSHTERRGNANFATAELAWGLIIALLRHIPQEAAGMKAGHWQTTLGHTLNGLTLGLLGLGRLGSHMVPIAKAFGMDVVAWSQNLTDEAAAEAGTRRVEKADLFRQSDIVSLHVVLSERTRGIVGRQELALMRPTAWLVNTSRGPLVDKDALVEALESRRIAGAALDVFDEEPLPEDDVLRRLDNALLTPHLGYAVREQMQVFYEDTIENILAFLDDKPIRQLRP